MKAYFITSGAAVNSLELREIDTPRASDGKLLVRVRAASLNRGEFIRGLGLTKPGAAKPAGTDGAGEVVGSGERVMGRLPGAFAEYALMDAKDAIPVPQGLSWEEAAAVPITFMVVHDMLVEQGKLRAGEWLLV
ncbi:MAG TPA: zinc-binding alcohol dehydrogenase, partial [Burkholderiales bacterium]|nr:zinc-binding alcohol dehydrogenase [Burkholderiales bacterium]